MKDSNVFGKINKNNRKRMPFSELDTEFGVNNQPADTW